MNINNFHFKQFNKSQRSTFEYWYYHWKAFNILAIQFHAWKPKYLFHDIEKPWMRLFLPYQKVQEFHRKHANHHIQYQGDNFDWEAMAIDWECSRYTKSEAQLNAVDTLEYELTRLEPGFGKYKQGWLKSNLKPVFVKFGLLKPTITKRAE